MLEKIKNWIIKVWDKHKDNLEPEEYKLSHDRFAKLILTDILTMIPSLMFTKYNTISVEYCNTKSERFLFKYFVTFTVIMNFLNFKENVVIE